MHFPRAALALFLALAGCSDPVAGDAGPLTDASRVDGDVGSDAGAESCGEGRIDVSAIVNTEGLVIARDGTVYYSQPGRVGRMAPGQAPDDLWASLGGGATTVWGMVLSADNTRLYVGAPGAGLFEVDTADASSPTVVVAGGAFNGVTLGPGGRVYYSDFNAATVHVFDPVGRTSEVVTASPIPGANGVLFRADGTLLVASYSTGALLALTLDGAGLEASRETFAGSLGSPDGVLLDTEQRVYVTDNSGGRLLRVAADGSGSPEVLLSGLSAPASIEAGAGALNCGDLYVATRGELGRYEGGALRVDSPWQ